MSDCSCDTGSSSGNGNFPNAPTMGGNSLNQPLIWQEISLIQQAILSASSQCQLGGGQYSTIVAGNTPMTFVTGVTSVSVTNGGSGYVIDNPAVKFIPPLGSSASGATATVTTNGGSILSVNITNGGTGYQPVPATSAITTSTGSNASISPIVDFNGTITGFTINNAGSGYLVTDPVVITRAVAPNSAYIDAVAKISSVGPGGEILGFIILTAGTGYQPSIATIQIVSTLNNSLSYPTGTGFVGTVNTNSGGVITSVTIVNSGAGYATIRPYLVITDPGSNAQTQVNLSGSSVSSITVLNPGNNYTQSATGTVYNPSSASLPNPPSSPAAVVIHVANNTFGTNPNLYYQEWASTITNKSIQLQINAVLSYFTSLGYTISAQTNPATGDTLQWMISW